MLALCCCTQVCSSWENEQRLLSCWGAVLIAVSTYCSEYLLLLFLWSMGSRVGELQYLPNTGLVAPWHMVSSPARIEPVSPALVVWFLTIESLGKSSMLLLNQLNTWWKLMFVMPKVLLALLYSLYYTCTHHYIVVLNHLIAQHIGDFYLWWFFSSHSFGTNILFTAGHGNSC